MSHHIPRASGPPHIPVILTDEDDNAREVIWLERWVVEATMRVVEDPASPYTCFEDATPVGIRHRRPQMGREPHRPRLLHDV